MKKTIIALSVVSIVCFAYDTPHLLSVWGDTMKIRRFKVGKLVRDKVPSLYPEGINSHERIMDTPEYIARLKAKLIEEAHEVNNAPDRAELIAEMADVLEVFHALAKAENISPQEIEAKRTQKYDARGGFEKRYYSPYVDVVDENAMTAYYQHRPQEYPEIPVD